MRFANLLSAVARAVRHDPATQPKPRPGQPKSGQRPGQPNPAGSPTAPSHSITTYDLATMPPPRLSYAPEDDGDPDPGEIVWGWVTYEEDEAQGKDRPLLVIGHGGPTGRSLVGIQLTAKDRANDGVIRRTDGKVWMDIGSGTWDRKRRPSEVRIDRLLLVEPAAVRREGGVLPRERFDAVVLVLRQAHGW